MFVHQPPTQLGTPGRVIEGINPTYISIGDQGKLFVTECQVCRYKVLGVQGERVPIIGSKGMHMPPFGDGWPMGIATDGEGNVYVASGRLNVASSHKVQKFNRRGELVKSVGKWGRNSGEFKYPWGVRYHNHQVYVCDSNNG